MKLEYQYGKVYFTDLHPGDIIPTWSGDYKIVNVEDIDVNGRLKTNITVSNKIEDKSE